MINRKDALCKLKEKVLVVICFVFNKYNSLNLGQVDGGDMIDGGTGQGQTVGCGGAEMDTASFRMNDNVACQFVKLRPCVNTQISQLFPCAQRLLCGQLRKSNIVFCAM